MEINKYEAININEKSGYISYTSPILKNKKGHKRQMTKSIKKYTDKEELNEILTDLNQLLLNFREFSNDYETFIEVLDNFSPKAVEWAFEKSDILDKYNQENVMRAIEKRIPTVNEKGKFILPTNILIGASGSGKTTFIKQLIGSINTNFPATMQANTTVGSIYILVKKTSTNLLAAVKFMNKSAIQERLLGAYIIIIKSILAKGNGISDEEIADIIYNNSTIFEDKKVKLEYLITKQDIYNTKELIDAARSKSQNVWSEFLKNKEDYDIHIYSVFEENISPEFFEVFEEFVGGVLIEDNISEMLFDIIESKVSKIIWSLYSKLSHLENVDFSLRLVDEKRSIILSEDTDISYPKFLYLELRNKDIENVVPSKELKQVFFKCMEYISSANEDNKENTLFPIVEHIRIEGNFKPIWWDNSEIRDYMLIDSEGIGHDITNQNVSMQLRELMSNSSIITVVQNGAEQMQTAFTAAVKSLIYNGWIGKSKFCFNRMEEFDTKAHESVESKMMFIESNLKNVFKMIVSDELSSEQRIVYGREHIFQEVIQQKSYYLEHIKESNMQNGGFISDDKVIMLNMIKEQQGIDETVKNKMLAQLITQFTPKFDPRINIRSYIESIESTTSNAYKLIDIMGMRICPQYRADIFASGLENVNNTFSNKFRELIYSCAWQTVKAFNVRIAYNWDHREWGVLQPEAMFIQLANRAIMSYLLNPVNVVSINEKFGIEFTMIIQEIVSEQLADGINSIARQAIYTELLNSCWKPAEEKRGSGSTWSRAYLITNKIKEKFEVDSKLGKYNELYNTFVDLIFENEYIKALEYSYR